MALPKQKPIKKIKFEDKLDLSKIDSVVWNAVARTMEDEIRKRLNDQTGRDKKRFPKKKYPERAGSHLFLVDTGESTKIVKEIYKDRVLIRPKRPEILKYHHERAPLFALDEAFVKKISATFKKKLKPFIYKQLKSKGK